MVVHICPSQQDGTEHIGPGQQDGRADWSWSAGELYMNGPDQQDNRADWPWSAGQQHADLFWSRGLWSRSVQVIRTTEQIDSICRTVEQTGTSQQDKRADGPDFLP